MRKNIFCLFLILCFFFQHFSVSATPQVPDEIIFNGIKYDLIPPSVMAEYYEKYPEKQPKPKIIRTNLWRGYVATYEIKNNELLVIDINMSRRTIENIKNEDDIKISYFNSINNLYNRISKRRKIRAIEKRPDFPQIMKADWYSGLLFVAQEKLTPHYESSNGYFTVLEIENGNYLGSFVLSNFQLRIFRNAVSEIKTGRDSFQNIYDKLSDELMPNEILEYLVKKYK